MAGLFGGRLASHANVTLLGSWAEGLQALRAGGILLHENDDITQAEVQVAEDPLECTGATRALVLVKSWQTKTAAKILATCLAPDGVAMTLQNGLGNIELLEEAIGPERAALGVTTCGAALLGPGEVRAGGSGPTYVASHPRLGSMVELLKTAGFEVHTAQDLEGLLWGKLAVNAGINALTALLEIRNGELLARPDARALMNEAAMETARVAEAKGIKLPYDDPVAQVEQVAERTAENESSMFQDIRRGAPTEVNAINGAVVREGERINLPTPINRVLWHLVLAKIGA